MEDEEFQVNFPLGRQKATPQQVNLGKLGAALKSYHDIDSEVRAGLLEEALTYPRFDTLNAKILAGALVLLHRSGGQVTPDFFIRNMKDVLSKFDIPAESNEVVMRYQESLLRYMRFIISRRSLDNSAP